MNNPASMSRDYHHCLREATKDCATVLEPGCQFGWNLRSINRPELKMVGVEVHMPYLQDTRTFRAPNVQYVQAEALAWMQNKAKNDPKSFDCVLMCDFIEHFTKPDAVRLLNYAEKIARKRVYMWVPEGDHMNQDSDEWKMGADHWQKHRSMWSVSDLNTLGYDVALWANHHTPVDFKGKPRSTGAMFAMKEFYTPSGA